MRRWCPHCGGDINVMPTEPERDFWSFFHIFASGALALGIFVAMVGG